MTFHKYNKIKQLGHDDNKGIFENKDMPLYIEEKVDGANFRFMITSTITIFGSRNNSIGSDLDEIGGNWKRCVVYIKDKLIKLSKTDRKKVEGYIFYGECMTKHSVDYDWKNVPPFLGFDVCNPVNEDYANYDTKIELFNILDLPVVKLIEKTTVKEFKKRELTDKSIPKSEYYSGQCEGIVIKNYESQIFAKHVTIKFKEVNKKVWGKSKKFADTDDERLVAMYCTNPRIDKCIFKLVDDGEELDLKMMHKLPNAVLNDIYEEHASEICWTMWSINFRSVKRKVSQRCLEVLKQVMVNSVLNK